MVDKKNNDIQRTISIKYFIVFFIIIFISDDTFNFGTNQNSIYIGIKYCIYLFLTIYLLYKTDLKCLFVITKSSLVYYLIAISILLTACFNLEISGGYIYQIWLFTLGFLIVNFFSHTNFIDVYVKIIFWLSLGSLIIFIISHLAPAFIELFPLQINYANASVYNLGICMVSFENAYLRNMSIFREPGVFMIYLNIALIFELFFKAKLNKLNVFVFTLAIFTTLSTAAFVALAIIFIAYLFIKNKDFSVVKNKLFVLVTILIAVTGIILSSELYSMIFDKVGKDNIADGSSLARGISVVANLDIFSDHLIFGAGIKAFPYLFEQYTLKLIGLSMNVGNNTNTISTVLAVYGSLFGGLYIYLLFSFARKSSKSIIINCFILLLLVILYSNEDLRYSLMSCTILMWGLKSNIKEVI